MEIRKSYKVLVLYLLLHTARLNFEGRPTFQCAQRRGGAFFWVKKMSKNPIFSKFLDFFHNVRGVSEPPCQSCFDPKKVLR